MRSLGSPRIWLAVGLCAAFLVAALVAAIAGSGSSDAQAGQGATTTATATSPTATTTTPGPDGEPTVTVPTTSAPTTTIPTTTTDAPVKPRGRQIVKRPKLRFLPVKPNLSTVSWPDKRRVSQVALRAGNLIAAIDGRNTPRMRTIKKLRPIAAANVVRMLNQVYATDPPPASAPPTTGRVVAMSLHEDPQTGARYVTMPFLRTVEGRDTDGVMILEFAPAQAIVTGYRAA